MTIHDLNKGLLLSWCLGRVSQICYDIYVCDRQKQTHNWLVHTMNVGKNANTLKMPPLLFLKETDFRFWKRGHRLSGSEDNHPNVVKEIFVRTKTALRSELRTECNKGKKYSFLCPIFGYIVTGENAQGSTYSWVDRFCIYMVSASYQLKGSWIAPYCRP